MPGNDGNPVMPELAADVQHELFIINHASPVLLAPIIRRYKLPRFDAAPIWLFQIAPVLVPYWS